MNVLIIYDRYSTHTNTVYEHLAALGTLSTHRHHFAHCGGSGRSINWHDYDGVVVHYSARLVTGVVSADMRRRLVTFSGFKVLFVQDEYDLTESLRRQIEELSIELVFTCVPRAAVERIYPATRFQRTRFVTTLTGFAPTPGPVHWIPIAERRRFVGYRGRALPYWYGDLGQEKRKIAERFRRECELRAISCDIEWDDRHRIYGDAWNAFLGSCRATLGTESGSNLFDDDGSLRERFGRYLREHPQAAYPEVRLAVLGDAEEAPLMNQISPRIFEAIASGTGLILYEGNYSGVVRPNEHYIPLRKDFSNIDEVFERLGDEVEMEAMIRRAWDDVIGSGTWSYQSFVAGYDHELAAREGARASVDVPPPRGEVTSAPLRSENVKLPRSVAAVWRALPLALRARIYPAAHAVATALRR